MVLAERNSELVRNGRRSRGPSPNNGHGVNSGGGGGAGGGPGGAGTPETSSDDDNSIKRNGKTKKQSEYEEKIRVGRDYQAVCPPLIPEHERKPEVLNDRALLVWSPTKEIPDTKLEEYISVAKEKYGYNGEQALGMLFWHKHDLERAVMDLANFTPFPDEWTVEDKVLFEQAFQFHGKSFHRIRQMLPDKSIASLVKYYYSWKKTRHRQSVMDRQEKAKVSKEGSENGSDNGSNEESDNDDKEQATASYAVPTESQPNSFSKSSGPNGSHSLGKQTKSSDSVVADADSDASSATGATTANAGIAAGTVAGIAASVASVSSKQQQQQQDQTPASTDSSSGGRTTPSNGVGGIYAGGGNGGCCSNCGVYCNLLSSSPHGKMCTSCHHHWRRTGNKRPTSGPYLSKRVRDSYAQRHKRKPPRGMYINHDDIVALANAKNGLEELLKNTNRETASLLSQVQLNKQNISTVKRKNAENSDDIRPGEPGRINGRWSNEELQLALQGVRKYGKDFQSIAEILGTKTETHVRTFYINNRRRYNLDQMVKKFEADRDAAIENITGTNATNAIASSESVAEASNNNNNNNNTVTSPFTGSANKKDELKKKEINSPVSNTNTNNLISSTTNSPSGPTTNNSSTTNNSNTNNANNVIDATSDGTNNPTNNSVLGAITAISEEKADEPASRNEKATTVLKTSTCEETKATDSIAGTVSSKELKDHNIVMEIDLEAEQTNDGPPAAKKIGLSDSQDSPKSNDV